MIPNLFSKEKIPKKIPLEMKEVINSFKNFDDLEFMYKTYLFLGKRYKPKRGYFFYNLPRIFRKDLNYLWNQKEKHLFCHQFNFLYRVLLVKSGRFKDENIKLKLTNTWFLMIHQYLNINIQDRLINVDIWAYYFGIPFGKYAHGFKAGSIFPKKSKRV